MGLKNSQKQKAEKSSILYSSIEDLPFATYVIIACSNDLKHLGPGSEAERRAAWLVIQDEWEQAVKGEKVMDDLQIFADIEKITLDLQRTEMLFEGVRNYGLTDELKEELMMEGYFMDTIDQLPQMINQIKGLYFHLDTLKTQVADRLTTNKDDNPTKAVFMKALIRISDYKKRDIRMNEITTLEFCMHYEDLTDYIDSMNKKQVENG